MEEQELLQQLFVLVVMMVQLVLLVMKLGMEPIGQKLMKLIQPEQFKGQQVLYQLV